MGAKRRIRKMINKGIRAKVGVDPKLERAADKILKADRVSTRRADGEKIRAARIEALQNPSKSIQELRLARQKKKIAVYTKSRLLQERRNREISRATDAAFPAETKLTQADKLKAGRAYEKYRNIARREGKASGKKLAQAAITEKKQFLVSSSAKSLNASAEKVRREVQNKRWSAAREVERTASPRQFKKLTGMRKKNSVRTTGVASALEARGHIPELAAMRKKVDLLKGLSKDQARISGGLRTGADRQIMAAQSRTTAGKRARSMAKAVGYRVGLAGFLAAAAGHLMGKEKRRG